MVRLLLAGLCLLFTHALGRSVFRLRRGREKQQKTLTWALRTTVTLLGVAWPGGFDALTLALVVLGAGSFALGWYLEGRPRSEDHLEDVMFPK